MLWRRQRKELEGCSRWFFCGEGARFADLRRQLDLEAWLGAQELARLKRLLGSEGQLKEPLSLSGLAGGVVCFVPIQFSKGVAAEHESLRKGVERAFVASGGEALLEEVGLVLDLRGVERDSQARVWHALSFLGATWGWTPPKWSSEKKKSSLKKRSIPVSVRSDLPERLLEQGERRSSALGRANNRVRTWAVTPFSHLGPREFREELRALARKHRLGFEFHGRTALKRLGAGAFLAVVAADPKTEAGIVHLSYRPKKRGAKGRRNGTERPIALVGKGLCYDTGGYNLKTGGSMAGMHADMTGAAVAASYLVYLAEMEHPEPVDLYCALAVNLISETGYTPNQVVTALDGTTIEVVDTDAEGRMVLSDTLALVRRSKPRLVIDYATLTGSAIRALGKRRSAVFSNRPELARLAVDAGEVSGERTWSFPVGQEYRRDLESKVADLLQCAENHYSDHIYAATFLAHFVGEETPWVHVDLSAQQCSGGLGLIRSDVTGFGLLWTDQFLRDFGG